MNYATTATFDDFTGGYKKITISIPDYLYRQIKKLAKPGEVSRFFTDALLSKVTSLVINKITDPWDDFLNAYKYVGEVNNKITTREAINMGRL
ncbi:hypothetical protein HY085_01205 [Candidatus Gottesmanbacteria bacterium]|nr:hypothetical protein [Candidatus Gottesmanbacteria bacterium]